MTQDYHHGVRVVELNGGVRPIRTVATAIVGVVCTAPDAGEATFPLDTPVLLTDVRGAIGQARTTGTLAVLTAIADQSNPVTAVVRVEDSVDSDATTSNVIGTVVQGRYTGLQALLVAESKLGVKPRSWAPQTWIPSRSPLPWPRSARSCAPLPTSASVRRPAWPKSWPTERSLAIAS